MRPSAWLWRREGQEVALPTCLSSQTHLSDEVTSLQGQREAQASLLEACPHGRKAPEWAKTPRVAHPPRERGRDDIRRASLSSSAVGFPVTLKTHVRAMRLCPAQPLRLLALPVIQRNVY